MEWEYPPITMNTEILNHTNTQKYTIIIWSTDSHTAHHCIWTHPYIIHKRIYIRDYFNIIFYALILIIYLKGPILAFVKKNKLSYAIDVETIDFYSPLQFEVLSYCLITFNLSYTSETLDLYILKHVVELVLQTNMDAPIDHMSMLLYHFPSISFPFPSW